MHDERRPVFRGLRPGLARVRRVSGHRIDILARRDRVRHRQTHEQEKRLVMVRLVRHMDADETRRQIQIRIRHVIFVFAALVGVQALPDNLGGHPVGPVVQAERRGPPQKGRIIIGRLLVVEITGKIIQPLGPGLGTQRPFANQPGGVAGLPQTLGQGGQARSQSSRIAGHQDGLGRRQVIARRAVIGKPHAFARQPVQIGGLKIGLPVAAQIAAPQAAKGENHHAGPAGKHMRTSGGGIGKNGSQAFVLCGNRDGGDGQQERRQGENTIQIHCEL